MVTGASTAQLAVVLVDARNGVVEQTRRHAAVAALLRVPHVVLAVNKMDLVGYAEPVFAAIAEEFTAYAASLGVAEITVDPDLRARRRQRRDTLRPHGLVRRPDRPGAPGDRPGRHRPHREDPSRFPVQYVDPAADRRAPRLPGLRRADRLRRPARRRRRHRPALRRAPPPSPASTPSARPSDAAWAPQSVTVLLADDLDVSRGDLIAPRDRRPRAHPGHQGHRLPPQRTPPDASATASCSSTPPAPSRPSSRHLPYRIDLTTALTHDPDPEQAPRQRHRRHRRCAPPSRSRSTPTPTPG